MYIAVWFVCVDTFGVDTFGVEMYTLVQQKFIVVTSIMAIYLEGYETHQQIDISITLSPEHDAQIVQNGFTSCHHVPEGTYPMKSGA